MNSQCGPVYHDTRGLCTVRCAETTRADSTATAGTLDISSEGREERRDGGIFSIAVLVIFVVAV
jgi:hypothetical protein